MTYPEFIKNRFAGKDVHIVASGPSLLGFDYSLLKGKSVIAVNNAYRFVDSEYCIFVDKSFPKNEAPDVFQRATCLSKFNAERHGEDYIRYKEAKIFSPDPNNGVYPRNFSGAAAICTAIHGGAKKIYLYGFDCMFFGRDILEKVVEYNRASPEVIKKDFYGHASADTVKHTREDRKFEQLFKDKIEVFNIFKKYPIFNTSPFSAIPYFEKVSYWDIL